MVDCCCSGGLEVSNNFYAGPLEIFRQRQGQFYNDHPVMSRLIFGVLGLGNGAAAPLFFPVWTIVGFIALPIIAIIQKCKSEIKETDFFNKNPGDYLKGWTFTVLALGGIMAIMALSSTVMPLIATCAVIGTGFAVSMSIFVYRAMRTPDIRYSAAVN